MKPRAQNWQSKMRPNKALELTAYRVVKRGEFSCSVC